MNTFIRHIRLDFRSQEPIYLQIVRQMEKLVREGVLQPGDQLPTVRQLAIDLRINFSTVARAYRILDEQKLISTQRGRGTYIWDEQEDRQAPGQEHDGAERQAARLVNEFVEGSLRQGLSLEVLESAFQQEIHRRRSTETE